MDLKIILHPMMVHFPVAFYFLEALLLLFWFFKKDDTYRRFAFFVFALASFALLVTIITGYIAAGGIKNITGLVKTHALFAVAVFVVYAKRAYTWHIARTNPEKYQLILTLGAILGCVLISAAAFYGGKLVYG